MFLVEIRQQEAPMSDARPTNELRWWQPLKGKPELQQAWKGE